jgi:hypothetical protein
MHPAPPAADAIIGAANAEVAVTLHRHRPGALLPDDLTDLLDPSRSSISYRADDRVTHTCRLTLDPDAHDLIAWGRDLLAPTMTIRSDAGTVTAPLGTYDVLRPSRTLHGDQVTVAGYDLVRRLTFPLGAEPDPADNVAVTIPVGADPIDAMRTITESRGLTLRVASAGDAPTLTRPRPVGPATTGTEVLDGLAADAGYLTPYAGPDGRIRSAPIRPNAELPIEWTYDVDDPHTAVLDVEQIDELEDVPNSVLYRTDAPLAWAPRPGDGQLVRINETDGPASRAGRGYPVWDVVDLPATNQTVLQQQADVDWETRSVAVARWELEVAPNPLHWHRDLVAIVTDLHDDPVRLLVTSYDLPLDGSSPMRLTGRTV